MFRGYKRDFSLNQVCLPSFPLSSPSVCLSVCLSVLRSVCLSVGRSVGRSVFLSGRWFLYLSVNICCIKEGSVTQFPTFTAYVLSFVLPLSCVSTLLCQ